MRLNDALDVRSTMSVRLVSAAIGIAVVAAACGSETAVVETAGPGEELGCENGAGPIADLLGTGLPTYDYDPVADLDELVATSDLVVTGTLGSAVRVDGGTDDSELEPIDLQFTQVEADEWEVLSPSEGSADDAADIFLMQSGWPDGGGDDPLASEVTFRSAEVRYLAFLHVWENQPAPSVHVQGFVIGCGDSSAVSVIEPLPTDAAGLSIAQLIDRLSGGDAEGTGSIDPDLEIDVDNDVILGFWLAESGSCPFAPMIDLRYDIEFQVIYPEVALAGDPQGCEDDDNPHLIIVAIPRSELPTGNLTLWVNGDEPWAEGSTFIADGELTRLSDSALPHPMMEDPGELKVGETKVLIGLSTHCGLERLYWPIDGRQWVVFQPGSVPSEWDKEIRGEEIDLLVTRTADDELEVTTLGEFAEGATYVPAPDLEGCD